MNIIDKINKFESTDETISDFNKIFTNCRLFGFSEDAIVTIGEIGGPETTRYVTITKDNMEVGKFRHNFALVESELDDDALRQEVEDESAEI